MALQSSITEFFSSRKRPAIDDVKKIGQPCKKVMILENIKSDVSECPELNRNDDSSVKVNESVRRKLIYCDKQNEINKPKTNVKSLTKKNFTDEKSFKIKSRGSKQLDIRKTFSVLNRPASSVEILSTSTEYKICDVSQKNPVDNYSTPKKNVIVDMENVSLEEEKLPDFLEKTKHTDVISGKQNVIDVECNSLEKEAVAQDKKLDAFALLENEIIENSEKGKGEIIATEQITPEKVEEEKCRIVPAPKKELNLDEIRSKLNKSSRCNELKATLSRLSDGFSKLEKLREKRLNTEKPAIKKFDSVSFDVLASPPKTPVKISSGMSPAKLREAVFKSPGRTTVNMEPVYVSPRKLFDMQPEVSQLTSPTKPPAFQRYQALISEGRSGLTLPFKYRSLAEIFRGIETVVSMMHNRRETVTFMKLKSAVQELVRRNLYEKHLSQIKTVFNDAFEISYEKVPSAGKFQPDRYELVVKPILKKSKVNTSEITISSGAIINRLEMTPDVLLGRRRTFYNSLLDKTKQYHEEFLLNLHPPIHVNRDSITRWHPEFDVDNVPDIEMSSLPDPPNVQKAASAKDVLERARNLFGSNPRLDIAMQKLKEQNNKANDTPNLCASSNTGPAVAALTNALKGIPKSLLEKVRAKQAAKALEAMTRSPSRAKEALRLTRLPEIARIVRNIFISEKKTVLTRELIIKKLADSFRENLSFNELNMHLDLLQEKTPEWLSFCTLRKTNYVKFVKDADMSRIMSRLGSIASENNF